MIGDRVGRYSGHVHSKKCIYFFPSCRMETLQWGYLKETEAQSKRKDELLEKKINILNTIRFFKWMIIRTRNVKSTTMIRREWSKEWNLRPSYRCTSEIIKWWRVIRGNEVISWISLRFILLVLVMTCVKWSDNLWYSVFDHLKNAWTMPGI